MSKILNAKDVTGTTRFNFDFKLTTSMVSQLLKEFREEYPRRIDGAKSIKLLKEDSSRALECSKEFISFFPPLDEIDTEEARKRIYKHVAKKADVYNRTAVDNLELSMNSMLTDDLRSCASLLYYSIHKFINGELYSFLNHSLRLEDPNITIKEIEHFTSANYATFKGKGERTVNLTTENYLNELCDKNARINPFNLSFLIKVKNDIIPEELKYYVDYLSNDLFSKCYNDPELKPYLEELVEQLKEDKRSKVQTTQEKDVRAAIAQAILDILNKPTEIHGYFYAITLRLYWLRQTADYEFDFEVKTSIRELSLIIATVKFIFDCNGNIKKTINDDGKDNKDVIEEEDLKKVEAADAADKVETYSYSLDLYGVAPKFPEEIKNDAVVFSFMTAVHLDSNFIKNDTIMVLNLTENITNMGRYFVFESSNTLSRYLYLYINDEGRWTFWFSKYEESMPQFYTDNDLLQIAREFLKSFVKAYKNILDTDYEPQLIGSKPSSLENNHRFTTPSSVITFNDLVQVNLRQVVFEFTKKIAYRLSAKFKMKKIKLLNYIIRFNFSFGINDLIDGVPVSEMIMSRQGPDSPNDTKEIVVNFLVGNKEKLKEHSSVIDTLYNIIQEEGLENNIYKNFTFVLSPQELSDFILGKSDETVLKYIFGVVNDIAYHSIYDNEFENSLHILEKIKDSQFIEPYTLATQGLWHFRNTALEIDEALDKGKSYYEKAIQLENSEKEEYIESLNQKYNFELARFYFFRKRDVVGSQKFLNLAKEIGQEGKYYEQVLELEGDIQLELIAAGKD